MQPEFITVTITDADIASEVPLLSALRRAGYQRVAVRETLAYIAGYEYRLDEAATDWWRGYLNSTDLSVGS